MISVTRTCGCWERHGLPPFIVDLRRTYKSRRAAGIPCAIDGYEGVAREARTDWNARRALTTLRNGAI
jgi:hypothetical protein